MSEIKTAITILCKHFKLLLDVNIRPEHFRLAKFNKNERNVVLLLWQLLHKLIVVTEYYSHLVSVGDEVTHAKLTLAAMDYDCPEFYCLPVNMDAGSRELLLAIAWLLANKNILEILYQTKLQNFVQGMDFDFGKLAKQTPHVPVPGSHHNNITSVEDLCNYLLWLAGKIRYDLNTLYQLEEQRLKLINKVVTLNKTLGELAEPSALHAKLKLHPELVASYDKKIDDTKELINTHKLWNKHCNAFWEWMETVLSEKRKQVSQSSSRKDTENLVILMNMLKCTVISLLASRSEIMTASHQEIASEALERCHLNITKCATLKKAVMAVLLLVPFPSSSSSLQHATHTRGQLLPCNMQHTHGQLEGFILLNQ